MKYPNVLAESPYPSLVLVIVMVIVCMTMCSCGTTKQVAVVERIQHDTIYTNRIQYDSIYQNDSFLMDYHPSKEFIYLLDSVLIMKVDTMYVRDRTIEYKYKLLHDTTYIHQVDTIPVIREVEVVRTERHVPTIYKYALGFSVLVLLLIIGSIVLKFAR